MSDQPLADTLVVDCSRMLPGAVLARNLLDLGARLIKIEDPRGGEMMRHAPPTVGGTGVGFCVYFRGAESLRLDLRKPEGMAMLERMLAKADVFIESFRPGTLARWGLPMASLAERFPQLVSCSLPAYGQDDRRVAHDLNATGMTGLLGQLPGHALSQGAGEDIPRVLIADINTGLLATSSILAALLGRSRTGRGARLQQSMLSAPLPLLTWPWADRAAGGGGMLDTLLAGRAPCYRNYRCGDGTLLSLGCLEPKFWLSFCQLVGKPELGPRGLDTDAQGQAAAAEVAELLGSKPRAHWLELFAPHDLPIGPVHELDEARAEPILASVGLLERTPMPDGSQLSVPGPALHAIGRTPERPAPRHGEHDEALHAEFAPAAND